MRKLLSLLPLAAVLSAATVLHAATISGQFSITGDLTDTGTALNFLDASTSKSPLTFTGTFSTLLTPDESVTANNPVLTYAPYVSGSEIFTVGPLTIDLLSFSEVTAGMFRGVAQLSAVGYTDVLADVQLTTQTFSGPVSFSATTIAASAVPEPSTLALLGTGLLGVAGAARRRIVRS